MKIISCPKGKWLELVEDLQECNYDVLISTEEPNMTEAEEILTGLSPTITRDDLNSGLQYLIGHSYHRDMLARSRLEKYGTSRTEVIGTLSSHVNSCSGCKTEYLQALDNYTESMMPFHKSAESLGITGTKDYLDGLSTYDILKVIKPRK